MEVHTGHLFRSQPPVVRLGGFSAPKVSIRSKTKIRSLRSSLDDSSFLSPLKTVRVSATNGIIPIAILPGNIGKMQKIPVLFKDLNKIKEFKQSKEGQNIILSELTTDIKACKGSFDKKLVRPASAASLSSSKFKSPRLIIKPLYSTTNKLIKTPSDNSLRTSRLI